MKKSKLKVKVLVLEMTIVILSSVNVSAQEQNDRLGGLFGENHINVSKGLMNRSEYTVEGDFTGQTFGAPLGSGLLVLLAASASYAKFKSRKNQNRKEQRK